MRRKPTNLLLSREVVKRGQRLAGAENKSFSRLVEDMLREKLKQIVPPTKEAKS